MSAFVTAKTKTGGLGSADFLMEETGLVIEPDRGRCGVGLD